MCATSDTEAVAGADHIVPCSTHLQASIMVRLTDLEALLECETCCEPYGLPPGDKVARTLPCGHIFCQA